MSTIRLSKRAYPHRAGLRFRLSAGAGRIQWGPVGRTVEDARELAEQQIAAYRAHVGLTVGDLVARYLEHLELNDRAAATVSSARTKLDLIVGPLAEVAVVSLGHARAKARYLELVPTCAVATHHEALVRAKSLWKWALEEGLTKQNPWAAVKPVGRPKRGKPQLTLDETNRLVEACLPEAMTSDGALAILVVIFCGVRSSEILQRVVRDVDAGGTRLLIPQAKTDAGKRAPELPAVIQAAVRARTRGRAGTEPLLRNALGVFPRSVWLIQNLKRYCQLAGVPVVCPHALRGGWASIAYSAGALSHTVAAALGHASPTVTEAHYARPEAVAGAKQAQRLKLLKGGRAG